MNRFGTPKIHRHHAVWMGYARPASQLTKRLMSIFLVFEALSVFCTRLSWGDSDIVALTAHLRSTSLEEPGEHRIIGLIDEDFDLCNPGMFRADAGAWAWIDVDNNGRLDPGVDQVDIGSGAVVLSSLDVAVYVPTGIFGTDVADLNRASFDGKFQPNFDWLFLDLNRNGVRDCGAVGGFSDLDPALGEPLFILDDLNGDGVGSLNEHLLRLGSSRVLAFRRGSDEFYRGKNLAIAASMSAERTFHGTAMANLVGMGPDVPGRTIGAAWMADLVLVAALDELAVYTGAMWAERQNADVVLFGSTRWALEPLDGSSPLEVLVDQLSDHGVVVVAPTGNLGLGIRHTSVNVSVGESVCVPVVENLPVSERYLTVSWRDPSFNPMFVVRFPNLNGDFMVPQNGISTTVSDAFLKFTGLVTTTTKSTHVFSMVAATIGRPGERSSGFTVCVRGSGEQLVSTHWTLADNAGAGVQEGSLFPEEWWDGSTTLTSPASADSAIAVGAVGGRYVHPDGSVPGHLRPYSSRGPRIDDKPQVTVVAPDDLLVSTTGPSPFGELRSGDWVVFGGTSAASAYVAGRMVLLRQLFPEMTAFQMKERLFGTATYDELQQYDEPSIGGGVANFLRAGSYGGDSSAKPVQIEVFPWIIDGNTAIVVNQTDGETPTTGWRFWWDDQYDGIWDVTSTTESWRSWPPVSGGALGGRLKVMAENPTGYRAVASIILTESSWDSAWPADAGTDVVDGGGSFSGGQKPDTPSGAEPPGCGASLVRAGETQLEPTRSLWKFLLAAASVLWIGVGRPKKQAIFGVDWFTLRGRRVWFRRRSTALREDDKA